MRFVTDEDSAFIPAFELFKEDRHLADSPRHILCAMHKEANFSKKLNSCGLRRDVKSQILTLFKQVAYSDNRAFALESLEAINAFGVPRLSKYVEKHVRPLLGSFAKAFLSDTFACGVNTTSAAESMNRLLKTGMEGRRRTLVEARAWFTHRLAQHHQNLVHHIAHRRNIPTPWEQSLEVQ